VKMIPLEFQLFFKASKGKDLLIAAIVKRVSTKIEADGGN